MADREYEIPEYFNAVQWHYVTASSKAEALQKVLDGEHDHTIMGDLNPSRPMSASNIRAAKKG